MQQIAEGSTMQITIHRSAMQDMRYAQRAGPWFVGLPLIMRTVFSPINPCAPGKIQLPRARRTQLLYIGLESGNKVKHKLARIKTKVMCNLQTRRNRGCSTNSLCYQGGLPHLVSSRPGQSKVLLSVTLFLPNALRHRHAQMVIYSYFSKQKKTLFYRLKTF